MDVLLCRCAELQVYKSLEYMCKRLQRATCRHYNLCTHRTAGFPIWMLADSLEKLTIRVGLPCTCSMCGALTHRGYIPSVRGKCCRSAYDSLCGRKKVPHAKALSETTERKYMQLINSVRSICKLDCSYIGDRTRPNVEWRVRSMIACTGASADLVQMLTDLARH